MIYVAFNFFNLKHKLCNHKTAGNKTDVSLISSDRSNPTKTDRKLAFGGLVESRLQ